MNRNSISIDQVPPVLSPNPGEGDLPSTPQRLPDRTHHNATGPLRIESRRFDQICDSIRLDWERLRSNSVVFAPPFFSYEFAAAVHAVRGDVDVAVLRRGERIVGLLPHHRRGQIAYPVGRFLNDAHQILVDADEDLDWCVLLRSLSLRSFDSHAMVGCSLSDQQQHRLKPIQSFASELGDDSLAYLRRLERLHKTIRRQPQKTRKLAREVGKVRIEVDCRDPSLLEQLIDWKRAQYRRTHILDLFSPLWTRQLLSHLHSQNQSCGKSLGDTLARGMLSVLWAGPRPVAAHFGILERGRLHYWFPAYDPEMAAYSPGTALYRSLLEAATECGIRTIDMGYGTQPYKSKQTDTVTEVFTGCVSRCSVHRALQAVRQGAIATAKDLPMKHAVKRLVRWIVPNAGISKLH